MLLDFDRNLTRDKSSDLAATTHKGMAHFAGTGPQGKTCRECSFWKGLTKSYTYYAASASRGATLKPHPCKKFASMTAQKGAGVPHNARACKYFDPNPTPPTILYSGQK